MKTTIALAGLCLALAACGGADKAGGGDKAALVAECVAQGETEALCTCSVDAVADLLDDEQLAQFVELTKTKDEPAAQKLMMTALGDTEKAIAYGNAIMACED